MNLTVTGGSGFLGRALVAEGRARGHRVRIVTRNANAPANGETILVKDYADTPPPADSQDVLIHLAQGNNMGDATDPQKAVAIAGRLSGLGYAKLCYASSAAVYGDRSPVPHSPDEVISPQTPYAALKLACEAQLAGCAHIAVRFTNLYGPGLPAASVLHRILSQIPGSGPLLVRCLTPVRDFCWVDDAAGAMLDLCHSDALGIFNVGSGTATSIGELARLALAAANENDRPVLAEGDEPGYSAATVDISRTTLACGWMPRTSLSTGLRNIMDYNR